MDTGTWLTATRVARLPIVLRAIRTHPPPGLPADRAERIVWRTCGGPLDDASGLITALQQAELISTGGTTLRLSKLGRRVATQDHHHGGTILARSLIRSGLFAEQARRLTEVSRIDAETGDMACTRQTAIDNCPQLVGLLRRFPGVVWEEELRVPAGLGSELREIWALLPASAPLKDDKRKAIGNRGELYSYHLEQLSTEDSTMIHWVAQDDEGLGYDIEDVSGSVERLIEVKASTSAEARFYLSANEWEVAHRHEEHYEIHFWGGINLDRTPAEEYKSLRDAGYPIVYPHVSRQLREGALCARPTHYVVEPASPGS